MKMAGKTTRITRDLKKWQNTQDVSGSYKKAAHLSSGCAFRQPIIVYGKWFRQTEVVSSNKNTHLPTIMHHLI